MIYTDNNPSCCGFTGMRQEVSQFDNKAKKTDKCQHQSCSTKSLQDTGELVSNEGVDKKLVGKCSKNSIRQITSK